jgi:hypothetical protein
MNLNHWHRVACLALLLPILTASGCTGTDVLTPTTATVGFALEVDNVPPDFRFETSRFRIRQITVRPVDANADAVLGAGQIGLMRESLTLNFNITESKVSLLPLATGTYRLESIIVSNFNFHDLQMHPCTHAPYPDRCIEDPPLEPTELLLCSCEDVTAAEYIPWYHSTDTDGGAYIGDFPQPILFHVDSGSENSLVFLFHWDALLEALQDSWNTNPYGQCDPVEPWCLIDFGPGFNTATFSDHVPDFLSIN